MVEERPLGPVVEAELFGSLPDQWRQLCCDCEPDDPIHPIGGDYLAESCVTSPLYDLSVLSVVGAFTLGQGRPVAVEQMTVALDRVTWPKEGVNLFEAVGVCPGQCPISPSFGAPVSVENIS
jgi:hypothetical protein